MSSQGVPMTDPDPSAKPESDPAQSKTDGAGAGVKIALITTGGGVIIAILGLVASAWIGDSRADKGPASTPIITVTAPPSATATHSAIGTPSRTARPPVERTMSRPKVGELVPVCTTVKGAIPDLPSNKTLVIANEENGDGEIFFEGAVDLATTPKMWRALVHLGNDKEPGRSNILYYEVWVVVMDKSAVESIVAKTGHRQWKSTVFPPGADPGDPVRVKGNGKLGICELGD